MIISTLSSSASILATHARLQRTDATAHTPNNSASTQNRDHLRSNARADGPNASSEAKPEAKGTKENDPGNRIDVKQQAIIRELASRDREVRAHELAHTTVGGVYASAASFSYKRGPDGRLYAIGGEVRIDASPIPGDPQATLEKSTIIRRAALAPADPSVADRRIASSATAMSIQARADIVEQLSQVDEEVIAASEPSDANEDNPELSRAEAIKPASANGLGRQLLDTGAVSQQFPQGGLIDLQV